MKLAWNNNYADIGSYKLELITDDGSTSTITVKDFTCPYEQGEYNKNPAQFKYYHPYDYEVHYCCGYSMTEGFNKPMTLEEVKRWAEDYLLDRYINHYNNILADLDRLKKNAEQAQAIKDTRN